MKEGWVEKALGDVCSIRPPKAEVRHKIGDDTPVSFLPMEDLGIGRKFVAPNKSKKFSEVYGSYTYFANGDVLLAKITPCFENGKLGIASNLTNGIGFGSSEFAVLRPAELLANEWLYYFLIRDSFRLEGAMCMSGAVGHKRVDKEFLYNYTIPIPPLAEQRRLVALLDEAFAGLEILRANAEKNVQNARVLFDSLLKIKLSKVSVETSLVKLETVCEFQNGFAFKSSLFRPDGEPIIRISNIQNSEVVADGLAYFLPSEYRENLDRYRVFKGDLLIAMSGATTGKIGFNYLNDVFYLNQRVGKFIPSDKLNIKFLFYYLLSKVEENLSISAGAAQPNLSTEQIRNFLIPQPSIDQQIDIVQKLDKQSQNIDSLVDKYHRKLAAIDELKQSLLHRAFSGQLTAAETAAA